MKLNCYNEPTCNSETISVTLNLPGSLQLLRREFINWIFNSVDSNELAWKPELTWLNGANL